MTFTANKIESHVISIGEGVGYSPYSPEYDPSQSMEAGMVTGSSTKLAVLFYYSYGYYGFFSELPLLENFYRQGYGGGRVFEWEFQTTNIVPPLTEGVFQFQFSQPNPAGPDTLDMSVSASEVVSFQGYIFHTAANAAGIYAVDTFGGGIRGRFSDGAIDTTSGFVLPDNYEPIPQGFINSQIASRWDGSKFLTLVRGWLPVGDVPYQTKWFLARWTPGGSYSVEEFKLGSVVDDALLNATLTAPGTQYQAVMCSANEQGWCVTINGRNSEDTKIVRYWQFAPDLSSYRELTFLPTDSNAEYCLDAANGEVPGSDFPCYLLMDPDGHCIMVSQAQGRVLGSPTVDVPDWPPPSTGTVQVRAWSLSLDTHDMYVLRLGTRETLVYDQSTGQWSTWSTDQNSVWAVNTGFTWQGGLGKGPTNIVVGDDTTGNLYWLDPEQPYDEAQSIEMPDQYFTRRASTYVPVRGRAAQPCYSMILTADMFGAAGRTITLKYSDDAGATYVNAGDLTLPQVEYSWQSLGQVQSPGRVFLVEDNGAAQRLDGMEMNDGVE